MNLGTTIKVEGGLLPPQLLERIAAGDPTLRGTAPSDYHYDAANQLNQAINLAWTALAGRWASFKTQLERLPESERATSLTRDKWLLPLFQELGFGRLAASRAIEADGRTFAVSHGKDGFPIHLVGWRLDLDKRVPGERGAAASAPHGLVQDCLNTDNTRLWAFLSNGRELRILRDHRSLTRQAYVAFDLESIFEGEQFNAFRLLWLLCHQSRVEAVEPLQFWLERWVAHARDEGVRALDRLREGVEEALNRLGSGFMRHRANDMLRESLRTGVLSDQDYYRQLLKLVYRLIFLFVAEDRDLLLQPEDPADPNRMRARQRFQAIYSTKRLRMLSARRRGGPHDDGWACVRLVMRQLDRGNADLALPALGSSLWGTADAGSGRERARAIPDLDDATISNDDFYAALAALCVVQDGPVRRPVDWAGVEADELGSVYEALMELVPRVNRVAGTFALVEAGGNERKTSGSYYTPTPLVDALLNVSLERALDDAERKSDPERALLDLAVVDPACGSGHFLVAAARRMAHRLARVRCGGIEPSPPDVQHALRDVVGHCIYGVDLNPMAVELCKVSLWMEGLEPGRPLSFLDAHIRHGNALIGATPDLMAEGPPDAAWEALEGDDKETARRLRRSNSSWRQARLFGPGAGRSTPDLASLAEGAEAAPDDSLDAVRAKERAWRLFEDSEAIRSATLFADLWCAAFVWPKLPGEAEEAAPVRALWEEIRSNASAVPKSTERIAAQLKDRFHFFHWEIAFPKVFARGGFDVVLGNPPWDTLSPDAKEFFSRWEPEVRQQAREEQQATIERLTSDPTIARLWAENRRTLFAWVHFLKQSGRFTLFAEGNLGKGDFNVYRMFVETALRIARPGGVAAQVVPDGLYSGANTTAIRQHMLEMYTLDPLLGFENAAGAWFPGVHRSQKFCVYAAARHVSPEAGALRARFGLRTYQDLAEALSGDLLRIPIAMVREFSPDALAVMEFTSQLDIDIASKMYAHWPKFGDEDAGPPHRQYMREIDMGTDRELFTEGPDGLPLYEGRMVTHYDHRAKGYRGGRGRSAEWQDFPFDHPDKAIQPQWFISPEDVPEKTRPRLRRYRLAFCDVTGATNERTFMATILPPGCLSGHSLPTILFEQEYEWAYLVWLAAANSFAVDFLARFKISNHMTFSVVDSLPIPRLSLSHLAVAPLASRVLRLTCTGPEMIPYWNAMSRYGWVRPVEETGPAPGILDEEERLKVAAEIEVIVACDLYGLNLDEVRHILRSFPILERRQRQRFGDYRTLMLIEECWQRMLSDGEPPSRDLGQPLELLREILGRTRAEHALPPANVYRYHLDARVREAFQHLQAHQEIDLHISGRGEVKVRPTLRGLQALPPADVQYELAVVRPLLPFLQQRFRMFEGREQVLEPIVVEAGADPESVALVLPMVDSIPVQVGRSETGRATTVTLSQSVLNLDARWWPLLPPDEAEPWVPKSREHLAARLGERLGRGGACVLIGNRLSGKTTVARTATRVLPRPIVELDLQVSSLSAPDDLAVAIEPSFAAMPRPAAQLRAKWLEAARVDRPVLVLRSLLALCRSDLTASPTTFGWLRGLGQEGAGILYLGSRAEWQAVMSAARAEPGSSFGNDVESFELQPLTDAEAREFLDRGGLPAAMVGRALRLGGRWPFTLNLIAQALVQGTGREREDVELVSGILQSWRSAFEGMWLAYSDDARSGLGRIITGNEDVRSWPSRIRVAAEDEGLLDAGGKPVVLVQNPLLCAWAGRWAVSEDDE